ncbi:MAG: DUF5678 domain-containing protein [Thermodesulfobacteriota bacterium]|nr:DUF5678 domain-containing protein [Thermodesulfobacteriota bacterium]
MMDKEATETQKNVAKLLENRNWFDNNVRQLQKEGYKGKAIAVNNGKIVAEALNPEELKKIVQKDFNEEETLMMVVPKEDIWVVPYPD